MGEIKDERRVVGDPSLTLRVRVPAGNDVVSQLRADERVIEAKAVSKGAVPCVFGSGAVALAPGVDKSQLGELPELFNARER